MQYADTVETHIVYVFMYLCTVYAHEPFRQTIQAKHIDDIYSIECFKTYKFHGDTVDNIVPYKICIRGRGYCSAVYIA